jgi:hypothetical protein
MTKQNDNNQTTEEKQISEQVKSNEYVQKLDEEELAEISGAGFGSAQHGKYIAETYGGNAIAKAKSYVHGLFTVDSKNGSYKTYDYAMKQAANHPTK